MIAKREMPRRTANKSMAKRKPEASAPTVADLEHELAQARAERDEALAQHAATAEVLQVINSSPGDLAPVFDAILEKAHTLCDAGFGSMFLRYGDDFRAVAVRGLPGPFAERMRQGFRGIDAPICKPLLEGERYVHIADIAMVDHPIARHATEHETHTLLSIPLQKDDAVLGLIVAARNEVRPFSDTQIALVENFAAQAVIAMENARLITETREALDQQTATAEVLGVINSSPGDLAPVFDAMLEKAMRLCEAAGSMLTSWDGARLHRAAARGMPPEFMEAMRGPVIPPPGSPGDRLIRGENIVCITDLAEIEANRRAPVLQTLLGFGVRSYVGVALRKDDKFLGTINVYRQEVRPYTDKQIALLENFAAQAVIAMENARLITETHEALEQQTATAEVLGVINSSPGDLAPVFDAILEKAHSLCGADFGSLVSYDGEFLRSAAERNLPPAWADFVRGPIRVGGPDHPARQLLRGAPFLHIEDLAEVARTATDPMPRAGVELAGIRTLLLVPLRKDDAFLGYITAFRQEVRPFTDKQIALLQNFAAQAVIAMENARLITETREALDQQTATAEVLGVINSSPGDLAPVFDAMVDKARRLCDADSGHLALPVGDDYRTAAVSAMSPEMEATIRAVSYAPGRGTAVGRALMERQAVQIADIGADPEHAARHAAEQRHIRTILGVPLLREGEPIGAFGLSRTRVEPFTERQIDLVRTFAAQAVIAIENARLITETRERTAELQESLEYQTATSDVLKVISRSPVDLGAVLDFVCETAARLCDVQTGSIFRLDGSVYRYATGFGLEEAYRDIEQQAVIAPGDGTLVGRVALTRRTVHILDGLADPDYAEKDALRVSKCHTILGVPLLRDNTVIGVICLGRRAIDGFSDKQIELVTTFADQAVIAIENVRLFDELRARTDEVAGLNRDLEARVASQLAELEQTGKLRRFLAPQLADLIVARGDESILESHRREIVVVFCDLRGFTAFAERAEPEELMALLRDYHAAMGPIVARFEGTLDHYAGDGIMVFFNDPLPTPEPAKRAIEMAVAMREAAAEVIKTWRRHGHDIGFGVGISQGYATLGQIGFAERMDYTAIGTVTNLAARLCAEAKDGQILISRRVATAIEEAAALEEIGDLSLKGLSQAVAVYNVVAVAAPASAS
jgi:GAF domain-containing protein